MTREQAINYLISSGFSEEQVSEVVRALTYEPNTGHWIEVTNGRGGHECDVCHDYAPSFQNGNEYLSAFCPNCGAKMAESEADNEPTR